MVSRCYVIMGLATLSYLHCRGRLYFESIFASTTLDKLDRGNGD